MVINGRLAKFVIGTAEFRDSYNLLPMPLAAGGEKLEIDYSILEMDQRDKPKNRELIKDRVRTDCVYLWQMIEKFVSEFGLHMTFPAASLHAWSGLSGLSIPKTTPQFYARIAPYYYGGRVECFSTGITREKFSVIDINSAYPYAMTFKHPWGENIVASENLPSDRGAIERSFITIRAKSHGAFPYRELHDSALNFPRDGIYRTFNITGWEYLAAQETGKLGDAYKIEKVLRLPLTVDFCGYIDNFYKMKENAKRDKDPARYEFAKKFLCSLYGKFGANPEKYEEFTVIEPKFIDAARQADGYLFCSQVADFALVSRPLRDDAQHYINVAVAASITGFVRAHLWRAICAAGGVLYCDTDAIACRDTGALEFDPTKLGAWDLEAQCNFAAIAGKKLYAFRTTAGKWKTASKGVKLGHRDIVKIAKGQVVEFKPQAPQFSLKTLRKNQARNEWLDADGRLNLKFQNRKVRKTAQVAV